MASTANAVRTAILGASGYTGAELVRILLHHPSVELRTLTADRHAGKPFDAVFPQFGGRGLPGLVRIEDVDWSAHDLVFCCLPHGTTQETIASLPESLKVVDLSADFRLSDVATYAEWYGHEHRAPALQEEAVYGLTEIAREEVRAARLVANPGCYPTSGDPAARAAARRGRDRDRDHRRFQIRRFRRRPGREGGEPVRRGLRGHPRLRHRRPPPRARDRAGAEQGGRALRSRSISRRT